MHFKMVANCLKVEAVAILKLVTI